MQPSVASAIRAIRVRRGLTQLDVARRAGVSRATVSLAERGVLDGMTVGVMMRIAAALDIRVSLTPRWRGGDLDRILDARHAALAERVAAHLSALPGWVLSPEVSFAYYADRGRIDILAWHPITRSVLIVELKTEIADVQDTLGVLDMKRRHARKIAAERGWHAETVSVWLVVAGTRTNRRRVAEHRMLLGAAFPTARTAVRGWLVAPVGTLAALTFWPTAAAGSARHGIAPVRRVRRRTQADSRA
jgi:transcriptional regulator with XRE-family HTH domain